MIRTKNPIGFELLYARYYRLLFSTAYAVLRQESDAMDAVQNAALRLYTMDESLFPSDHELAWLHTVVKNEALMVLRKKKPEHSVDELPEIPVPERQLEMLEDMETVQTILFTKHSCGHWHEYSGGDCRRKGDDHRSRV